MASLTPEHLINLHLSHHILPLVWKCSPISHVNWQCGWWQRGWRRSMCQFPNVWHTFFIQMNLFNNHTQTHSLTLSGGYRKGEVIWFLSCPGDHFLTGRPACRRLPGGSSICPSQALTPFVLLENFLSLSSCLTPSIFNLSHTCKQSLGILFSPHNANGIWKKGENELQGRNKLLLHHSNGSILQKWPKIGEFLSFYMLETRNFLYIAAWT